jgi:hypothetical protein
MADDIYGRCALCHDLLNDWTSLQTFRVCRWPPAEIAVTVHSSSASFEELIASSHLRILRVPDLAPGRVLGVVRWEPPEFPRYDGPHWGL